MFHVETSATLPFTPVAVFAAVGSVESALRWQVGVLGVRRVRHRAAGRPGRPAERADDTLLVSYFALGVRHLLTTRVTAYEPPDRFAYRADGPAFALDVALEAAAALGGTRVTYHLRLTTHQPPALDAAQPADAERRAATLRRLLGRRAPRDLARLEVHMARRLGACRPRRDPSPAELLGDAAPNGMPPNAGLPQGVVPY